MRETRYWESILAHDLKSEASEHLPGAAASAVASRAKALFDQHGNDVARRCDRMFAVLMILQWVAGVAEGSTPHARWAVSRLEDTR